MLSFLSALRHPLSIALTVALLGTSAYAFILETTNMHLTESKAELATQYSTAQTQISVLGTQNKTLTDSIGQLSNDIKQAKQATDTLSAEFEMSAKRAEDANKILRDIQNAPQSDDAPLAPVLRHALDGLRRHDNATSRPTGGGH